MKLGIICPSEIALRRFMPALRLVSGFEFAGIGVCSKEEYFGSNISDEEKLKKILDGERGKAQTFIDQYGGEIFEGYETIIKSDKIDALYIPLPPALHYKWSKKALECGKHVLVEKPSTMSKEQSADLVRIANEKNLAIHENYMFAFHNQLNSIENIISSGEIGDVRLYRISFGFPRRDIADFRYNKALGGGALIDAGGYTIKYAMRLLGETAKIKYAVMNTVDGYEVDMYGSAALVNSQNVTAQIAFGMDNNYKCELEVWGSKGCLTTGRILTAPDGFEPLLTIRKGNVDEVRKMPSDNAFKKSIDYFEKCIRNKDIRIDTYRKIIKQAQMVDEFRKLAKK